MKSLFCVLNSDSINRVGSRFTVSALVDGLWASHDVGMPLLISHDFQRPLGWQYPFAIHFEPGLTRLAGVGLLADSEAEFQNLTDALTSFIKKQLEEQTEEVSELKSLVGMHVSGDEKILAGKEALAMIDKGLCKRMFPEIFSNIDKDGLVSLKGLNIVGPGVFKIGKLAIFADSFFRRSLSRLNTLNVPFLRRLQGINSPKISVKIALDPDAVGLASTYRDYEELEYWWGPKFKDELSDIEIGMTHHEAATDDRMFHGISGSQFWWQSRDGKHIFETEELRDIPSIMPNGAHYGCRYVHSIVDEKSHRIDHLDGAVRLYSEEKMIERLGVLLSAAGRNTEYKKLWRLDGVIPLSTWKSLVSDYFRDNRLVGEYLGGIDNNLLESDKTLNSDNHNWVPYSMQRGDGIRVALSFHESEPEVLYKRSVVTLDSLNTQTGIIRFVESWVLELEKALLKGGEPLSISSDVQFLTCKDFYINFPLIRHNKDNTGETLSRTIEAYELLVRALRNREYDQIASFTVQFPVDGKEARVSVLGHINDLYEWLRRPLARPPMSHNGLVEWSEKVAQYLSETYLPSNDEPALAETLMPSGVLLIKRQSLSEKIDIQYEENEDGLMYSLLIPEEDEALRDLLLKGVLAPAAAFFKVETRCTKCKQSYRNCPCSKMLESGVTEEILEAKFIRPFWTDRPLLNRR